MEKMWHKQFTDMSYHIYLQTILYTVYPLFSFVANFVEMW